MNFIKRYKARRAKRKEIAAKSKALTSTRIQMGSASSYDEWERLHLQAEEHRDQLYQLQTTACKL